MARGAFWPHVGLWTRARRVGERHCAGGRARDPRRGGAAAHGRLLRARHVPPRGRSRAWLGAHRGQGRIRPGVGVLRHVARRARTVLVGGRDGAGRAVRPHVRCDGRGRGPAGGAARRSSGRARGAGTAAVPARRGRGDVARQCACDRAHAQRHVLPLGLYLLLASLGVLAFVAQSAALPTFSRFVERSQRYALFAALLSAVWTFLLVTVVQGGVGLTWEAALLLFVLAFTAQPLLTEARMSLTERLFPGGSDAEGLARALADSEARAAHAQRLAEIGTMASAVAHEVRNPLGVITACLTVLERQGADATTLDEIRQQVARAATFSDELLEYGRPGPVRPRDVQMADLVHTAATEVSRALPAAAPTLDVEGDAAISADPTALVRLFGILFENATLAPAKRLAVHIRDQDDEVEICVEDDGPGVPDDLVDRLFAPFVSGRGRGGPRPGTGLGLAIARGIVARCDRPTQSDQVLRKLPRTRRCVVGCGRQRRGDTWCARFAGRHSRRGARHDRPGIQ